MDEARPQWDSGNNAVAAEPGVVFTYLPIIRPFSHPQQWRLAAGVVVKVTAALART